MTPQKYDEHLRSLYPDSVYKQIRLRGELPVMVGYSNCREHYRFSDGTEVICCGYGQVWSNYDNWAEVLKETYKCGTTAGRLVSV